MSNNQAQPVTETLGPLAVVPWDRFDNSSQVCPGPIFGLDVEAAAGTAQALHDIQLAFPNTTRVMPNHFDGDTVRSIAYTLPLVTSIRNGVNVRPREVRPYTEAVIETSPTLSLIADISGLFGLRWLVKEIVANKFPGRAQEFFRQRHAAPYLGRIASYAEVIASGTETPRQQFTHEVSGILVAIRQAARERRGTDHEVRAQDFGHAARLVLSNLVYSEEPSSIAPVIKSLIARQLGQRTLGVRLPSAWQLAAVAPEIIGTLESIVPETERDRGFLESVERNRSGWRWAAAMSKMALGKVYALETAAPRMLAGIRDLLPETSAEMLSSINQAEEFFLRAPVASRSYSFPRAAVAVYVPANQQRGSCPCYATCFCGRVYATTT